MLNNRFKYSKSRNIYKISMYDDCKMCEPGKEKLCENNCDCCSFTAHFVQCQLYFGTIHKTIRKNAIQNCKHVNV